MSSFLTTLHELSLAARLRGDTTDANVLIRAAALVRADHVRTERDISSRLLHATADDPVVRRLRGLAATGSWVALESALADLPSDLRALLESDALTLEQLAALHASTGATSVADVADLVRREQLRDLPGLSPSIEEAVARVLPTLRRNSRRVPLGRATTLVDPLLERLRARPEVAFADAVGSLRRGHELIGDIELVAATDQPQDVFAALARDLEVTSYRHRSERRQYFVVDGSQIGVRCAPVAAAGATMIILTGTHSHLDFLQARASQRGWSLTPDGLALGHGDYLGDSEASVYETLGLQWVPPEIRDGLDELRAAETGTLPALLEPGAIRGDLHMHTTYSDGRDTVEAMVQACVALGYEYMAITDHSPRSAAAVNLTTRSVSRQAEEIAALRGRYPQIVILHGCEVDILPDGRLDFSDRVLERFDIVLASLHDRAGQNAAQLMERYESAMRHPLVSIVTHPTNRVVPGRPGYDLDYDRLFATAVETGTILEIDGAPSHLDLDGTLARRAVAAGAMLVVDSDSHRAALLGRQMALGVKTARRGWAEARHVMNTRPIGDIRTLVAGKRSRHSRRDA